MGTFSHLSVLDIVNHLEANYRESADLVAELKRRPMYDEKSYADETTQAAPQDPESLTDEEVAEQLADALIEALEEVRKEFTRPRKY